MASNDDAAIEGTKNDDIPRHFPFPPPPSAMRSSASLISSNTISFQPSLLSIRYDSMEKSNPSKRQQMMIALSVFIAFVHPICRYSVDIIVPFYVMETPEKGWNTSDLSYIFAAVSTGEIIGSQSVTCSTWFKSRNALFIAHFLEILGSFIGYGLMSSDSVGIEFNKWLFCCGMFLVGFSYGVDNVQTYCKDICAGDTNLEVLLMEKIGQGHIVAFIVSSFMMPPIYSSAGFQWYAFTMMILSILMMIAFFVLVTALRSPQKQKTNNGVDLTLFTGDQMTISRRSRKKKKKPDEMQMDHTKVSVMRYLSPSLYVLIFIKFVQSACDIAYDISYTVVFAEDFDIDSHMAGVLYGTATILSLIVLKGTAKIPWWQYPLDFMVYLGIMAIGFLTYIAFYKSWIGYSIHIFAVASLQVSFGAEMTVRIFLCPEDTFQAVTGIMSVVQAVTGLLFSILTPVLLGIERKLPFWIMAILVLGTVLLIYVVYWYRVVGVLANSNDSRKSRSYLDQELRHYMLIERSFRRRPGAMYSLNSLSEGEHSVRPGKSSDSIPDSVRISPKLKAQAYASCRSSISLGNAALLLNKTPRSSLSFRGIRMKWRNSIAEPNQLEMEQARSNCEYNPKTEDKRTLSLQDISEDNNNVNIVRVVSTDQGTVEQLKGPASTDTDSKNILNRRISRTLPGIRTSIELSRRRQERIISSFGVGNGDNQDEITPHKTSTQTTTNEDQK